MRPWVSFAASLILLVFWGGWANAQNLYGLFTPSRTLFTIDTVTGAGTVVGLIPPTVAPRGLGSWGGKLYTFNAPAGIYANKLVELDPATGNVLGSVDIGFPPPPFFTWAGGATNTIGIAFRSDGIGFIEFLEPPKSLYQFDIKSATKTLITGALIGGINSLAFDSADVLYGIGGGNQLYIINQATGATTLVGSTGTVLPAAHRGLAFNKGICYSTTWQGLGFTSNFHTINPATGTATGIGNIGVTPDYLAGIAFANPLPGPKVAGGEGSFAGSKGPGGFEGAFGFRARDRALSGIDFPLTPKPRIPTLELLRVGESWTVFNVSQRNNLQPGNHPVSQETSSNQALGILSMALVSGLALILLVKKGSAK